jgi:hypothetical protein
MRYASIQPIPTRLKQACLVLSALLLFQVGIFSQARGQTPPFKSVDASLPNAPCSSELKSSTTML